MKTYSIGRDTNCDIVINDTTDVISRRHALLNVTSSGKMTIIDQSTNGTYVNGIRISPNTPVPITRKDTVSLAHVVKLDWNRVPKENGWVNYAVIAAVAVFIVCGIVFGMRTLQAPSQGDGNPQTAMNDTVRKDQLPIDTTGLAEEVKKRIIADMARKDSIDKVRKDSIDKAKKAPQSDAGKSDKDKDKKDKDKEKGETPPARVVGG